MTGSKAARWFHRKESTLSMKPGSNQDSSSNNPDAEAPKSGSLTAEWILQSVLLALELADQAVDIAQVAPVVGPAAALLRKIIDSYQELKSTEENHDALVQRIADITGDICAAVLRMQETNHSDQIGRLKQDLEKYATLITRASEVMKAYDSQGKLAHFSRRNERQSEMDQLNNDLDSFGIRFANNRLVDLCIEESMSARMLNKVYDVVTEKKLENWLRSPPVMTDKQQEIGLCMEGTGEWLLNSDSFIEWEDNPGVLWIEGPWSGKSVLSSTIIQRLFEQRKQPKAQPPAVAWFYFDFRKKETQSIETALRRIVLQLSAQSPNLYQTLDNQYNLVNGQKLPTYLELQSIFHRLLQEFGHTYVVLDALDECDSTNFDQLVNLVLALKTRAETGLHLLITSQTRDIFEKRFGGMNHITLEANVMQDDIKCFVTSKLQMNPNLKLGNSTMTLADWITEKSNGMFRLAVCLLTELSYCIYGEDEDLEKILETLPNTLFGIYDRFMLSILPQHFPYAEAALRWIMCFRYRHLHLVHLADAISFKFSNLAPYTYKPKRQNGNTTALPTWLAGLIQIDGSLIKLVHASVQDYLLSDHFKEKFSCDLSENLSHGFISRSCISYLLYFSCNRFEEQPPDKYPMGKYAAKNWYHHLLRSDDKETLLGLAMQLLEDGSGQYYALSHLVLKEFMPPLHFCCRQGYLECVSSLLANGADINAAGGDGSPLITASSWDHIEIVHLLLNNGANMNLVAGEYGSALTAASYHANIAIVRLLIENNANINLAGRKYGTALAAACYKGNLDTIYLLLDTGVDLNVAGGEYGSALAAASYSAFFDIVNLLLMGGADVNSAGGIYGTALGAASYGGHLVIVRLLLKKGASVNLAGGEYGSALGAATYKGALDIVDLLLHYGADINIMGAACASPYQKPIRMVQMLLMNGVHIKLQGSHALKEATDRGREDIVALLYEYGAQMDKNAISTLE
ncbi:hypothetical protein B0H12DRAFT_1220682 [Mycena haematopus]|nr:hypothetical protein B0H12DRAFT_1220682 [Mycena haematopus]